MKQIKNTNLNDEKNNSKNDDFVNEKMNFKIFEFSKKNDNNKNDKINVDENHEIIKISNNE